jgi:hypothetical protein
LQLRDCTKLQLDGPIAIGRETIAIGPNPVVTMREPFATVRLDQLQLARRVAIGAVAQLQLSWVQLQLVCIQLQLVHRVAIGAVA